MRTLSGNSAENQTPNGLPRHIFESEGVGQSDLSDESDLSDLSDLSDGAGGLGGSRGTDDSILEHAL